MKYRELVVHNFWLKFCSLVLATMTWFTIFAVQRHIRFGELASSTTRVYHGQKIALLRAAGDSTEYRLTPTEISLTISGSPSLLQKIPTGAPLVYLNLTDRPGATVFTKRVEVQAPEGATVVEIQPAEVRVERLGPRPTPLPLP
jgi:hypothetical protein